MAVYPCSIQTHRYPQRQRSLYITTVSGSVPETRKHRACPMCFHQLVARVQDSFTLVEDDTSMEFDCEVCGQKTSGAIFVKAYAENGEEPAQYVKVVCEAHASQVLQDLEWRSALPVGR